VFAFPYLEIISMIIKSIPVVFINPLFWVVIFLVWTQYRRTVSIEEKLFGATINSVKDQTLIAILYGIIGGIIGSFLLIFVGVSISNIGLGFVWFLAIILMMIQPRFMCFSYAGGIVSLISLILGYPKIDVPGLMAIVAILHFIEGVLIYTSGFKGTTPIFIKDNRYGVIGGFSLQKFWPVPIIILLTVINQEIPEGVIQMPDWWPLVRPSPEIAQENLIYIMFPIVAGLGYGDMVLTSTPEKKSRLSAINLSIFSLILLLLAIIASRISIFKYAAALFAPLAHEFLIYYGKGIEKKGRPVFIAPERGEMVLDVLPGSPGYRMGLKRGDIILAINGMPINSKDDLKGFFNSYPTFIWIDGRDKDGNPFSYEYRNYREGISSLGAILVPREGEAVVSIHEAYEGILLRYIKKLIKKRRKE
jgi:hypothetical protein